MNFHTPVLSKEIIDLLLVKRGKKYIDATIGGGGHTREILKRGGVVLGIDIDQEAIDYVQKKFKFQISNGKLRAVRGNFRDIDKIAHSHNFDKVAGIVFDLGVSSHQIEESQRGFSFAKEGPLDMRMDKGLELKASDLVNLLSKKQLYEIFSKLGQDRMAHTLAKALVRARRVKAIETTTDLVGVIKEAHKLRGKVSDRVLAKISMRPFQALRIAVNDELENLRVGLTRALSVLSRGAGSRPAGEKGGRLLVISFHSLEDGIVKQKFKEFEKNNMGKILTDKPIIPSLGEISVNRRARSAKLRAFEVSI